MNFLAAYTMQGRMQAMIVASSLALLSLIFPPANILSSASVALVTLRLGAREGLYVLGCAAIAAGALGFILLGNYLFPLLYVMVLWLPVWLISIVLREGRHLSLAVEIAVLLGVVGVVGFYLYNPEAFEMWKKMLGMMVPTDSTAEPIQATINTMAHYMTGVVAAGTVFSLLFGLFLGRWWQANLYNPGGFRTEFLSLTTHPRLAFGTVLVLAIAVLSSGLLSEAAWNVSVLLLVLYGTIGCSVLHFLLALSKWPKYVVPLFYITLFLIPHALLLVALVGLADTWLDLRKKFTTFNAPKA